MGSNETAVNKIKNVEISASVLQTIQTAGQRTDRTEPISNRKFLVDRFPAGENR